MPPRAFARQYATECELLSTHLRLTLFPLERSRPTR